MEKQGEYNPRKSFIKVVRNRELDFHFIALDINERKVQSVATQITHAVQADATDESILNEPGVKNFDTAVVAVGSDI